MVFLTSNANVADEGTEGRANEMKVEIILANVEAGKIALPVFQPANGLECSASDQAGETRTPPAHRAGLLPGPEHRHGRPKGDLVCQDREDCRGVCLPARDTWTGSDPWRAGVEGVKTHSAPRPYHALGLGHMALLAEDRLHDRLAIDGLGERAAERPAPQQRMGTNRCSHPSG